MVKKLLCCSKHYGFNPDCSLCNILNKPLNLPNELSEKEKERIKNILNGGYCF